MAETISEINADCDLLRCCLKAWLQLLNLSQRSIFCHWMILLASVLPQYRWRLLIPSFCLSLCLYVPVVKSF